MNKKPNRKRAYQLLIDGLSLKIIGERLGISHTTMVKIKEEWQQREDKYKLPGWRKTNSVFFKK